MKKYFIQLILTISFLIVNLLFVQKVLAATPYDQTMNVGTKEDAFSYRLSGIAPLSLRSLRAKMSVSNNDTCYSGVVTGGTIKMLVLNQDLLLLGSATTSVTSTGGWITWNFSDPINLPSTSYFIIPNDGVNSHIECSGSATPNVFFNMSGATASPASNYWFYYGSTTMIPQIELNVDSKKPVLIIPGLMGTEIKKGSDTLWVDVARMLNPFHDDSFMDPLSFNFDGSPLDQSLTLGPVIDKKPKFDYTQNLIDDLISDFQYKKGANLFLFPYDWRRDIDDVAVKDDSSLQNMSLRQVIDEIVSSSGSDKIDIVAHSQGGLVVKRLLLDFPEYKSKIDKLIFVGTPNLGAPEAAKTLLYGDDLSINFLGLGLDPQEVKKISQNMPSVYELLPSQQYFNHVTGYLGQSQLLSNLKVPHVNTLDFTDSKQSLKDKNLNANLIDAASLFHSAEYDNLDFTNSGIKTYSIVGCQTGTLGKIFEKSDGDFDIRLTAGDGTVPLFSASNIPGSTTYYALKSSHSTLLTDDGSRQEIENLITGNNNSTHAKITQNISDCHFNGTKVSSHSPVELHIYDNEGNHVGPTSDGGFDYQIPNVGYDTVGHANFAFLPSGGEYTIKLTATDSGSFSFGSSVIKDGEVLGTTYYGHIPITSSSTANIILNSENNQDIQLDINGDGQTDQSIAPSSIIGADQSQDLIPPVSTSTLVGEVGKVGFYRSDVKVELSAFDPVISGEESQTSGLLNIHYSLDAGPKLVYYNSNPIIVSQEGQHVLKFFSTDRAGNNELEQEINFFLDKTPPEFTIQFNPSMQSLVFTASDAESGVSLQDFGDVVVATDTAGNTAQINFAGKDKKHNLKADLKSISYNGNVGGFGKNLLHFEWSLDKNNKLKTLTQHVSSKKDFNIVAAYNLGNSLLTGNDQSGEIFKVVTGLVLLKVSTNKGDLVWSY